MCSGNATGTRSKRLPDLVPDKITGLLLEPAPPSRVRGWEMRALGHTPPVRQVRNVKPLSNKATFSQKRLLPFGFHGGRRLQSGWWVLIFRPGNRGLSVTIKGNTNSARRTHHIPQGDLCPHAPPTVTSLRGWTSSPLNSKLPGLHCILILIPCG